MDCFGKINKINHLLRRCDEKIVGFVDRARLLASQANPSGENSQRAANYGTLSSARMPGDKETLLQIVSSVKKQLKTKQRLEIDVGRLWEKLESFMSDLSLGDFSDCGDPQTALRTLEIEYKMYKLEMNKRTVESNMLLFWNAIKQKDRSIAQLEA